MAAGAVVLVAMAGVGFPWLQRGAPSAAARLAPKASDPFAARRGTAKADAESPTTLRVSEQSFIEPVQAARLSYTGGDFAAALAQYRAAVEKNPNDADAWSDMGQVLVRLGKPDEAISAFNRALQLVPERWTYHFNLARANGLLEHWDQAIAEYREASALFPNDYVTHFNLGLALHKSGDDASAVEAYQKAIALAPAEASFRMALGISYERLQKPADAAAAYEDALRLSPDAPDADKVRGRIAALTSPPPTGG